MSTKKVYLAGPMRGIPEFNFPAFMSAAEFLRKQGFFVFNPAERDIERLGVDISKGNEAGSEDQAAKEHGFNLRTSLYEDMRYICLEADAIALLPGWEKSKGANAELATALALGLSVMTLEKGE